MAQLPPLRPIVNNTPADADDVRANFDLIERNVNTEVINRDGSVAMRAPLSGPAGTQPDHYVTVGQLGPSGGDGLGIPTGMLMPFAGAQTPIGWAPCDGREVSTTDPLYANLFSVIGFAYGNPGSGNFNLPNLTGRVIAAADPNDPAFVRAATGGSADLMRHTHDDAHDHNMAHTHFYEHNHTVKQHTHSIQHGHAVVVDNDSHSHSIDHNHASVDTSTDTHNHTLGTETHSVIAAGTGFKHAPESGANRLTRGLDQLNTINDSHKHSVNLPNYTGRSGSDSHTHSSYAVAETGDSGQASVSETNRTQTVTDGPDNGDTAEASGFIGEAGTGESNWPPYIAMTYLVKL